MDVKQLEHVNDDGLEQWRPVLKAAFPLRAADVRAVLAALGVDAARAGARGVHARRAPRRARRRRARRCAAVERAQAARALHGRRLHGRAARRSRTDGGSPGGRSPSSPRIRALVIAAVRELGLGLAPNVSFARGLKSLVGFGASRYAVIDVGTNSVKFHVGERRARTARGARSSTAPRSRGSAKASTRPAGSARSRSSARSTRSRRWPTRRERDGVEAIAAVGTAGLRIAANTRRASSTPCASVRRRGRGHPRRGGGAARLPRGDVRARRSGEGRSSSSTRAAAARSSRSATGDRVDEQFSVNVGAARFTERFGLDAAVAGRRAGRGARTRSPPTSRASTAARRRTRSSAWAAPSRTSPPSSTGSRRYDPDVVQGTRPRPRARSTARSSSTARARPTQRREIVGLQPKRAEVILAGACIVRTVLDKLGRDSLIVSDRGLRHGLIVERFGRAAVYDAPGDGDAKGSGGRAPVS